MVAESPERVRVAVLTNNGNFIVNRTSKGQIEVEGGYEAPFLDMLMQGLHLYPVIHASDKNVWGALNDDGSWSGLVGMVHRGEADMAISSILITEKRMEVVDFSYPYSTEQVTFATRLPGMVPTASALVRPFSSDLWLSVLVTLIMFSIVLNFMMSRKQRLEKTLSNLLGCVVNQPFISIPPQIKDRILIGAWLCATFFLSKIYSSFLLSFLTLPIRQNAIKDVPQLSKAVASGAYQCYTTRESSLLESLSTIQQEDVKIITAAIKRNDWLLSSDKDLFVKYALRENSAIIRTRRYIHNVFQDDVFASDDSFFSSQAAVVLPKNSTLKTKINKLLNIIAASGVYFKATNHYLFQQSLHKNLKKQEDGHFQKISIKDLNGAILFLITGFSTAFIACILEILWYKWKKRRTVNKRKFTISVYNIVIVLNRFTAV